MQRRYQHGDEIRDVAGQVEGERLRVTGAAPASEAAAAPGDPSARAGAAAAAQVPAESSFDWEELGPGDYLLRRDGHQQRCIVARQGDDRWLWIDGHIHRLKVASEVRRRAAVPLGELSSPMPGQVLKVHVQPGQAVVKGQPLLILEAMKMQYEIAAPRDGVVARVHVKEGSQVAGGVALVTVESGPAAPEEGAT